MKIDKVLKLLIQFYLILFSLESFASFGDSCESAPVPYSGADNYLRESTAYGHIVSSIDMRSSDVLCDKADKQFKFCLRNRAGSLQRCKIIALNVDESKRLGDLSTDNNPDLGANSLLKNIILTVKNDNGLMCLSMATSRGLVAVACKRTDIPPPPPSPDDQCRNIGKTCYMGTTKSQSLFNFSGLAVDCLKETLDKVFFRYDSCKPQDEKVKLTALNSFASFQESMKLSIRAALILYVMFFAINMILTKEYGNLDKIASFTIKLLLVIYFATGMGGYFNNSGKETNDNGMLQYGLPLLTQFTPEFAQIVFNSGGSRGLCEFDSKKYKSGYSFYALWDAVDCRIAYYLGMGLIYNTESILNSISNNTGPTKGTAINIPPVSGNESPKALHKVGAFRFFTVMFGFLLSGNIIIVVAGIVFSVIFISMVLYFISHYLVCLVTIYVMTYISPIFIPMALFTRTKAYFDAWLKISISCALQPAVVAGFIALLLTMYDSAIYKNCEFMRHDYVYSSDVQFSTFELRLPNTSPEECQNSAGYKLLQYYSGVGWEKHLLILFSINNIGLDVLYLLVDLLYVFVFSVIFYYFSKSIGQFAAEITSGPIMDSVTASPTKIVDMVKKAIDFLNDAGSGRKVVEKAGKEAEKERKGGEKEGEGKDSGGGEAGGDKAGDSSGGGEGGGGMPGGGSGGGGGMPSGGGKGG
jgi:type IV secretion system protein VirB6